MSNSIYVVDHNNQQHEVTPKVEWYAEAAEAGLTLPQYLQQKIPTDSAKHGTAYEQVLAGAGLYLRHDRETGYRPPKLSALLAGPELTASAGPASTVRPDGSQALTVAGRILFPSVVLSLVESQIMADTTSYEGVYNRMVAVTDTVDSPRIDQPIVNVSAPRNSTAAPIAQMAEPKAMVSISLSDKSYRIPTFSIGFEVSDEATRSTTLDFVAITLQQQILGQRAELVNNGLVSMISGDDDLGITALGTTNTSTLDSAANSAANFTNKAWIKALRANYQKWTPNFVLADIDTYLAIEGRAGRPTTSGDAGADGRLTTIPTALLPGIPGSIEFFLVPTGVIGANTFVLLDSTRAIRRVVYVGATYSAIEAFVMRRSTAMRFDFAEASFRLHYNGDGWQKYTFA